MSFIFSFLLCSSLSATNHSQIPLDVSALQRYFPQGSNYCERNNISQETVTSFIQRYDPVTAMIGMQWANTTQLPAELITAILDRVTPVSSYYYRSLDSIQSIIPRYELGMFNLPEFGTINVPMKVHTKAKKKYITFYYEPSYKDEFLTELKKMVTFNQRNATILEIESKYTLPFDACCNLEWDLYFTRPIHRNQQCNHYLHQYRYIADLWCGSKRLTLGGITLGGITLGGTENEYIRDCFIWKNYAIVEIIDEIRNAENTITNVPQSHRIEIFDLHNLHRQLKTKIPVPHYRLAQFQKIDTIDFPILNPYKPNKYSHKLRSVTKNGELWIENCTNKTYLVYRLQPYLFLNEIAKTNSSQYITLQKYCKKYLATQLYARLYEQQLKQKNNSNAMIQELKQRCSATVFQTFIRYFNANQIVSKFTLHYQIIQKNKTYATEAQKVLYEYLLKTYKENQPQKILMHCIERYDPVTAMLGIQWIQTNQLPPELIIAILDRIEAQSKRLYFNRSTHCIENLQWLIYDPLLKSVIASPPTFIMNENRIEEPRILFHDALHVIKEYSEKNVIFHFNMEKEQYTLTGKGNHTLLTYHTDDMRAINQVFQVNCPTFYDATIPKPATEDIAFNSNRCVKKTLKFKDFLIVEATNDLPNHDNSFGNTIEMYNHKKLQHKTKYVTRTTQEIDNDGESFTNEWQSRITYLELHDTAKIATIPISDQQTLSFIDDTGKLWIADWSNFTYITYRFLPYLFINEEKYEQYATMQKYGRRYLAAQLFEQLSNQRKITAAIQLKHQMAQKNDKCFLAANQKRIQIEEKLNSLKTKLDEVSEHFINKSMAAFKLQLIRYLKYTLYTLSSIISLIMLQQMCNYKRAKI